MINDAGKLLLPSGPSRLCFNKDDFIKDNFSVDKFVSECRKIVQLESLREDLNVYLQILKSAMIELINKDYADFVNLSTNLVGLDRSIGNLIVPVGQLKEEVKSVKLTLDNVVKKTDETVLHKNEIRQKRNLLQRMTTIISGVDKLEKLLDSSLGDSKLTGNTMERIASEIHQLQFAISNCKNVAVVEKQKLKLENMIRLMQQQLTESLLKSINQKDIKSLEQHLRIFALLGKTSDVELLFRRKIVSPFIGDIINEKFFTLNALELKSIYAKILDFIPKYCKEVVEAAASLSTGGEIMEYNFMVNCVWAEIVYRLESKSSILYSVTNATLFHERYLATLDFIEKFENLCFSQACVQSFRNNEDYKKFTKSWNLAVYFQIRFQEIAGLLESSVLNPKRDFLNEESTFQLNPTKTLWHCMNKCWANDVFLKTVSHCFWKLSLLLLSRYDTWVTEFLKSEVDNISEQLKSQTPESGMVSSYNIGSDNNSNAEKSNGSNSFTAMFLKENSTLPSVIALMSDINLLNDKCIKLHETVILPSMKQIGYINLNLLLECQLETHLNLKSKIPLIGLGLSKVVTSLCTVHLRLVQDIPRLYRRTNREVPAKHSTYVGNVLSPLNLFLDEYKSKMIGYDINELNSAVINEVTDQYYTVAFDVLTSVKKVEDSLKRLKKAREKNSQSASNLALSISDDDKIRLQLYIDVEYYSKQVEAICNNSFSVIGLESLVSLVESARNSPNK